ncbi:MAG: PLDc N-terminal domain-containing protein [Aeromicrobium sp.]|uniref:PLDc N-terminal domain-containing protein n=1 Tax=Aeromicrobium sp. TaxID=1871063 RepID=UPI003C55BBB4
MGKFFLAVFAITLLVYALFDLIATPRDHIRGKLPKPVWFVVILLPVLGPVLWLTVGHRRIWNPPPGGGRRRPPRPPRGPMGPDDDPDYLRGL